MTAPAERPPLADLRVVEWTETLAGAYAGFLLAGFGAEVVKVMAPGAAPGAPGAPGERVLERGKRSAALDLARDDDAACWTSLTAGADVVVSDEGAPAVAPVPGLVRCRVSAWGETGPRRGLPADEALVAAATGVQALQWSWARRPVWVVTPIIGYMTGMLAALGAVAAVYARERGAPGQSVRVSGVGAACALNSGTYVRGPGHQGSLAENGDPRGVYPTYGLYRTADGWLFVGALTQTFWVKLMTALERVDLLAHPLLQSSPLAFGVPEVKNMVRAELDPIFARRTTAEWVRALSTADIPCGAVKTRAECLADAETRALDLAVQLDDPLLGPTWQPPAPAVLSRTPLGAPSAAPLPGADTAAVRRGAVRARRAVPSARVSGPCLAGIRVLDLASFIAGPLCPMLLADLGADVVKVESPEGDPFRMAAFGFLGWNRGKRSLVLDLKRADGRRAFLDLARTADVVVDNFRAGVMERLGIGWETLAAGNPRLVHTSITGYGLSGPLATLPGFDPVFQAHSGLVAAQGGSDDPVLHMIAYNDYCAGTLGALATVAALLARERSGCGQRVDVSLFRTSLVAQAAHMLAYPGQPAAEVGGRDYLGPRAGRRLYAAADGWLCVAATTQAHADALGAIAGCSLALDDAPDGPPADALARVVAALPRAAALERLATAGVPAAPCLGFNDVFADVHLRANGYLVERPHPTLGMVSQCGPFIDFEATPAPPGRPAPALGADGEAVLRDFGFADERIATLGANGVLGPRA
jgi:crotonobetainyl-CoA:carnitine CoA-transferase CaiB-like acyl-CoA transferase